MTPTVKSSGAEILRSFSRLVLYFPQCSVCTQLLEFPDLSSENGLLFIASWLIFIASVKEYCIGTEQQVFIFWVDFFIYAWRCPEGCLSSATGRTPFSIRHSRKVSLLMFTVLHLVLYVPQFEMKFFIFLSRNSSAN